MPVPDLASLIAGVLGRAPEWVRRDLAAKEAGARRRAEDVLAAMISSVIVEQGTED